jgi:hypothetical protein
MEKLSFLSFRLNFNMKNFRIAEINSVCNFPFVLSSWLFYFLKTHFLCPHLTPPSKTGTNVGPKCKQEALCQRLLRLISKEMSALYFGVDVVFLLKTKNDYKMNNSGLHGQYHEIFDLQLFFHQKYPPRPLIQVWFHIREVILIEVWLAAAWCSGESNPTAAQCSRESNLAAGSQVKKHYEAPRPSKEQLCK